jgi:hypothetical protein
MKRKEHRFVRLIEMVLTRQDDDQIGWYLVSRWCLDCGGILLVRADGFGAVIRARPFASAGSSAIVIRWDVFVVAGIGICYRSDVHISVNNRGTVAVSRTRIQRPMGTRLVRSKPERVILGGWEGSVSKFVSGRTRITRRNRIHEAVERPHFLCAGKDQYKRNNVTVTCHLLRYDSERTAMSVTCGGGDSRVRSYYCPPPQPPEPSEAIRIVRPLHFIKLPPL